MSAKNSWVGTTFVNPVVDYFCVGGLLSLLVLAWAPSFAGEGARTLALLLFFVNFAHFSSSTVRLYARQDYSARHPFLTMGLPAAAFVGVTLCIFFSDVLGRPLNFIYMTWAPYHFSRQTYGLAIMYAHRSGLPPTREQSRLLLTAAMFPFWLSLFTGVPADSGLGALISPYLTLAWPGLYSVYSWTRVFLAAMSVLFPIVLALAWRQRTKTPFPLIIPLLLVVNAVWLSIVWVSSGSVWPWVTIFHGLQYLIVILYFHSRERTKEDGGAMWPHALRFYGWTLVLSYALWRLWPYAYQWAGLGYAESVILVVAAINIHHFVVDAYIWSVRTDKGVRKTMNSSRPARA